MVIKAMAMALKAVPDANVTWTENTMLKHKHADVGVAVSIPGGLITPVIRNASAKSLSAIAAEMKDLASRAPEGRFQPGEYSGGTASLSNLGMFGIKQFDAVINPPEGMILAIGAGAALGAVVGYLGQCSSGTCPLTATWWRGALYGGSMGLLLALSARTA
jgi:pyruvate dehydrogenase E2 component (dihydrolipoamide acetyltransferase)